MTDNEHQYQIEVERAQAAVQQCVESIDQFGGDIRFFSITLLAVSVSLFGEVHSEDALSRAVKVFQDRKKQALQPYGRA